MDCLVCVTLDDVDFAADMSQHHPEITPPPVDLPHNLVPSDKKEDAIPPVRRLHVPAEQLLSGNVHQPLGRIGTERLDLYGDASQPRGERGDIDLLVVIDHVLPDD
jgi:hypothetical protein